MAPPRLNSFTRSTFCKLKKINFCMKKTYQINVLLLVPSFLYHRIRPIQNLCKHMGLFALRLF
jgi:hypothetical protein